MTMPIYAQSRVDHIGPHLQQGAQDEVAFLDSWMGPEAGRCRCCDAQ